MEVVVDAAGGHVAEISSRDSRSWRRGSNGALLEHGRTMRRFASNSKARRPQANMWSFFRGYQVGSSAALVPSWGMLYTAHETPAGTRYIVALDATRGTPVWEQRTAGHPHTSIAVDVARGLAFGADNHGFQYSPSMPGRARASGRASS